MVYLSAKEVKLLKALIKHGKEGIIGIDDWVKETGLTIHELRDVAHSLERKGLCRVYVSLAKPSQTYDPKDRGEIGSRKWEKKM